MRVLAAAAAYLSRAGITAAALVDHGPHAGDPALLAAVRDQLLAGAGLCDGLLDLLRDGRNGGDDGRA